MIVDKYGNFVRKFMWQLCGWGRVDLCMTFHKRAFDFFYTICAIMKCQKCQLCPTHLHTQLPHTFSYVVAILIHNYFESPNTTIAIGSPK
jgi:hypothetical protein